LVLQVPDLMLFQETVADEIRFAPRHLGVPAPECDEITRDILERMGLTELADEAPFSLSRGQRLRAAVGSVLSMRPRVLLLDEPTTGQDREQIERMMDGLAEGFDLVVFCTHDVDTAARHSNRVIVLAEGGVLLDGPPGEVLFDAEGLGRARIRQTSVLRYASRLGVRALGVGELVEILK
jgi:energy-coupling factor transport system ATP-binding protein